MCATCGCDADEVRVTTLGQHDHLPHEQGAREHGHHDHEQVAATRTVAIGENVLATNDRLAQRNRAWLASRGAVAVNLMSSAGSGKTTRVERTIGAVAPSTPVCVVEGDQETLLDAERIRATGCPVVQINTTRLVDSVALPVGPVLAKLTAEDGDAHWVPGPAPTRGPQRPVRTWRGSNVDPFRAVWRADRR